MDDIAIKVENLSKIYKLYDSPMDRLRESLHPFRKKYHKDFYALKDVNFEIKKGETVGIIGMNGSGKSTLLKLITGVLTQSSGSIKVNGHISAILELGAGFNPEFTGIENVYFNCTLMGYTKEEMDSKLDAILSFADIGDFIYQPVKTYSSGMFVRLAFAVAVNVDPDILIVDEALAVGDMYFQEKCVDKMKNFKKEGKTIIYVSHSLPSIRNFCNIGIWIDKGTVQEINEASYLCEKYQEFVSKKQKNINKMDINKYNSESAEILHLTISPELISTDQDFILEVHYRINRNLSGISLAVSIVNEEGKLLTLYNTVRDEFGEVPSSIGDHIVKLIVPKNDLLTGKYYLSVYLGDEIPMVTYSRLEYALSYSVQTPKNKNGLPITEGIFRSKHYWEVVI